MVLKYYSVLYQGGKEDLDAMGRYLKERKLPTLTKEQRDVLNLPISAMEVNQAINDPKTNRVPQPDILTACYYKGFEAV